LTAYQTGLAIARRLISLNPSNASWQRDMQFTISKMGELSYRLVLVGEFAKALEAVDQTISNAPDKIWLYANRAHALMFLDRAEEARALYLQYRGEQDVLGKPWNAVILEDFAELRKAGLIHPLMDEIEKQLAQ
jgi:tetratricopeptide (TPR) repeat protein